MVMFMLWSATELLGKQRRYPHCHRDYAIPTRWVPIEPDAFHLLPSLVQRMENGQEILDIAYLVGLRPERLDEVLARCGWS